MTNNTKYSAYTVAKNCVDVNDCRFGLNELENVPREKRGKLYYAKQNALLKKLAKLEGAK